jgi:hypothetical protein
MTRGGAIPFGLHRALASWGEGAMSGGGDGSSAGTGDATWLYRFYPTVPWTQPGGDFVATASATTTLESAALNPYIWTSTPQLVADVQSWVNDPSVNFGWIVVSAREGEARTAKQVLSRESNPPPRLMVRYSLPVVTPGPDAKQVPVPVWALVLVAAALGTVATFAARRSQ